MNNTILNNKIEENNSPLETTKTPEVSIDTQHIQGQVDTLGVSSEVSSKVKEQVGETPSENWSGSTGQSQSKAQTKQQKAQRKQQIQIAAVQKMTQPQLVRGIKKEMQRQISTLTKQAQKMQRNIAKYSAYQLNKILSQIRKIKMSMAELAQMAIERLREMYIKLVLKFKTVVAAA